MECKNTVFVAQSLDGYISDKFGGLDWLHSVPNTENFDMGYDQFIVGTDAIVMGRNTFQTVCSFDIDWPYSKPVFVLSSTLTDVDEKFRDKVVLLNGSPNQVLSEINQMGYYRLYIDGGMTIQNFLQNDLIDELIITTLPLLLGGGVRLFAELPEMLMFEHVNTKVFVNEIVQSHYKRMR